jgi:hypothetical protein
MIATVLALAASVSPVLSSRTACRLVTAERIPVERTYWVRGTYSADGIHGSYLQVPKCKDAFSDPQLVGDAAKAVQAWHEAFRAKCKVTLFGDEIDGVFTGRFIKQRTEYLGRRITLHVLEITRITTHSLDTSSITCPSS